MKVCTCLLLFRIFADIYTVAQDIDKNPRSVNLALETVLEFREKDKAADLKFLDNIQQFITKIKKVIVKNKNARRNLRSKANTFTGFIQEVVNILNTYDNDVLKDFFNILHEEIREYHYRGCKFYELTENVELRKQVVEKLDLIKGKPVAITKAYLNVLANILEVENYDKNVKEFIEYVNSLYKHDGQKFQKVLTDLEYYSKPQSRKADYKLVKIIRDAVRSVIFDHYTNLSSDNRRILKAKIDFLWILYRGYRLTSRTDNFYSEFITIRNSNKKPELVTNRGDLRTINNTAENKTSDNNTFNRIEINNSGIIRLEAENDKNGYKNTRGTTKSTNVQTIWVEESTGGIPKYILNQLTTTRKPKHHSKHKTHESKTSSKHKSKHEKKTGTRHGKHNTTHEKKNHSKHTKKNESKESKHKPKHKKHKRSKYRNEDVSMSENKHEKVFKKKYGFTNMEMFEYKKMMSVKDVKHESTDPKSTTTKKPFRSRKSTVPTKKTARPAITPRVRAEIRPKKPNQQTSINLTKSSVVRLIAPPIRTYSKRNKLLSGDQKDSKKTADLPLFVDGGLSVELVHTDLKPRSFSIDTDPNIMKRLNNLEKELKDVKSRINVVQLATEKFEEIDNKEIDTNSEAFMRADVSTVAADKKPENEYVTDKKYNFNEEKVKNDNKSNKTTSVAPTKYLYGVTLKEKDMKVKQMLKDQDFENDEDTDILDNYEGDNKLRDKSKFNKIKATSTSTKATTTVKYTTVTIPTYMAFKLVSDPITAPSKPTTDIKKDVTVATIENMKNTPKTTSQIINNIIKTTKDVITKGIINNNATVPTVNNAKVINSTISELVVTSPTVSNPIIIRRTVADYMFDGFDDGMDIDLK